MLEQEIASAIKFVLANSENPAPYYYEVPQDFLVPAAYFPVPEISSKGDTFRTYALEYVWFIKFFHKDEVSAYALGFKALNALRSGGNLIPLVDEAGAFTGRGFRLKDPSLKRIDGAAQLTLLWDSPRPYNASESEKMMSYDLSMFAKNALDVAAARLSQSEE
jgi:hypothetical protein